jgi:hypothetical protein
MRLSRRRSILPHRAPLQVKRVKNFSTPAEFGIMPGVSKHN